MNGLNGGKVKVMSVSVWLENLFPNLKQNHYKVTSPYDPSYNCIAWAADDNCTWWEPDPMGIYYWPRRIPRKYSVESYRAAYERMGYKIISEDSLESNCKKVAIFSNEGVPTHVARQLESGYWTSKIGKNNRYGT